MFDVHFHWFPTGMMEVARAANPKMSMLRPPFEKIEDSLRVMDENGIEMALIGYGAFRDPVTDVHQGGRAEGCRMLNEATARLREQYPGRFLACAAVDIMAGEAAVPELERAVRDLGCNALEMLTCYDSGDDTVFPEDKRFWPLYAKAEELGVPVLYHPVLPSFWRRLPTRIQFTGFDWGFLLGDLLAINMMASGGVFDAFPKLQFIFCQLGGWLPFSLGRSDLGYAMNLEFQTRKPPSDDLKMVRLRDYAGRFYVDTHSADSAAIRCAVESIGADKILYATDWPITRPDLGAKWHREQMENTGLGDETLAAMKTGNAKRLFGLEV